MQSTMQHTEVSTVYLLHVYLVTSLTFIKIHMIEKYYNKYKEMHFKYIVEKYIFGHFHILQKYIS